MSNNVGIVTGDEWARIFFKLDHIDGVKSLYRCVQCHAGSQLYTCHTGHGYTNLKNHVTAKHPETFSEMVNEFKGNKNGNTLLNHSNITGKRVTKDGTKYFNWLQYCVFLDHPLTAADNKVERMFSRCKIIMNDLRASMHPKILENFMMLRENKSLWGQDTVEDALTRKDIQWPDQIENEEDINDDLLNDVTYDSDNEA